MLADLPVEQPVPGDRQLDHGRCLPAGPQADAQGSVHPPADPVAQLLRPQPGRRADEPPDQRHRRHQPGRLAKRHLADRQRALHGRHRGRHVRAEPLAGTGHPAGGADHVLVHQFRRPLHPQGLPRAAEAPGRAECGHGRIDQRREGDQGLPPQRIGDGRLPPAQPGSLQGRRVLPTAMPCC